MHQVGLAKVVQTLAAQNLRACLPPDRLLELQPARHIISVSHHASLEVLNNILRNSSTQVSRVITCTILEGSICEVKKVPCSTASKTALRHEEQGDQGNVPPKERHVTLAHN